MVKRLFFWILLLSLFSCQRVNGPANQGGMPGLSGIQITEPSPTPTPMLAPAAIQSPETQSSGELEASKDEEKKLSNRIFEIDQEIEMIRQARDSEARLQELELQQAAQLDELELTRLLQQIRFQENLLARARYLLRFTVAPPDSDLGILRRDEIRDSASELARLQGEYNDLIQQQTLRSSRYSDAASQQTQDALSREQALLQEKAATEAELSRMQSKKE